MFYNEYHFNSFSDITVKMHDDYTEVLDKSHVKCCEILNFKGDVMFKTSGSCFIINPVYVPFKHPGMSRSI